MSWHPHDRSDRNHTTSPKPLGGERGSRSVKQNERSTFLGALEDSEFGALCCERVIPSFTSSLTKQGPLGLKLYICFMGLLQTSQRLRELLIS